MKISQDPSLQKIARIAYHAQSFRPEDRGRRMLEAYQEELDDDIRFLKDISASDEQIERYSEKYKRFVSDYFYKESRVMSSMVTGPANFPVRRNQKKQRSVESHLTIFNEWRTRAKRAIKRSAAPEVTLEGEIESNKQKLETLKSNHERMKTFNALMRKKLAPEEIASKTGFSIELVEKLLQPGFMGRRGFAQFQLTNNLATIKNTEERIKLLESKKEKKDSGQKEEFRLEGKRILVNSEADRIQIFHDEKPSEEERAILKRNAFKWSPSNGCWQRKITGNAIYATKRMYGL